MRHRLPLPNNQRARRDLSGPRRKRRHAVNALAMAWPLTALAMAVVWFAVFALFVLLWLHGGRGQKMPKPPKPDCPHCGDPVPPTEAGFHEWLHENGRV